MTEARKRPKVTIGYVHPGHVEGKFHESLLSLILARGGCEGRVGVESGPRIATSRNQVVRHFLEETSGEYLWMVDADMTFQPDTVDRLLDRAQELDVPILGGLAFGLNDDGDQFPVLFRLHDGKPRRVDNYPRGDTVEVSATGAACLLIRRDVLEKMELEYPTPYHWFEESSDGEAEVGEDVKFCLKASALGFPIVVDTSIVVGHVKTQVIDDDSYWQQRRIQKKKRRKGR